MNSGTEHEFLWWVIPGALAGMAMPYLHPRRRLNSGGALHAFADDLPGLHRAGIRAVVSLLNIPNDAGVYEAAGFAFLCLPIDDGSAPTPDQAAEFVRFAQAQRTANQPLAVHCEAGLGRTGTMLAVYLISQGATAPAAIQQVRAAEPAAIETPFQLQFLEQFARRQAT